MMGCGCPGDVHSEHQPECKTTTGDGTMNVADAISRSISHTEIVACEYDGQETDLLTWIEENTADCKDFDYSQENNVTLDIYSTTPGYGAWRIRVSVNEE